MKTSRILSFAVPAVVTAVGLAASIPAVSCSQPGSTEVAPAQASASSSLASTPPLSPALAPASAAASGMAAEPPAPAPTEKFEGGAQAFAQVKEILAKGYYRDGVTEDDLYRGAAQGMLEHVDPKLAKWNTLLSPTELAELKTDLKGEIVGIGVQITSFDPATGYSDVGGVVPGSPAERAGLAAGDVIVTVDGKLYRGHPHIDVVRAIRGNVGQTVTLTVLRGDKLVTAPIKRDRIVYAPVDEMLLPNGIGYVHLRSFSDKTPAALSSALAELAKKNVRALIVDLRENPGGSFDDAVAVAEQLVPQGAPIVTLKRRAQPDETVTSKAAAPPVLEGAPIAVLVDHGTSSSAELLTAALREERHAHVVGSHTFGKWTVQTIEDLPNGWAMKYTTALFASPSGQSFDGVGLSPDVDVDSDPKAVEKMLLTNDPEKRLAIDAPLRTAAGILAARL